MSTSGADPVIAIGDPLRLIPGETYVIECSEPITPDLAQRIRWQGLDLGVKLVVLAPGMRIARETSTAVDQ